jgi:hypothetical protein
MTEEKTDVVKCIICEEVIDVENDSSYYSEKKGGDVCSGCEESDMESASTVYLIDADGEKKKVLVSEYFVKDAEYFEDYGSTTDEVTMTREYIHTDGWRGFFKTSLEGYEEIKDLTGWTTGFSDEYTTRKNVLNEWCERMLGDDDEPRASGVEWAIVFERTSNVFSTAVGVWVKEGQRDAFVTWLDDDESVDYETLKDALG